MKQIKACLCLMFTRIFFQLWKPLPLFTWYTLRQSTAWDRHISLNKPDFWRIAKNTSLKRASTSAGRLSIARRYTVVHLEYLFLARTEVKWSGYISFLSAQTFCGILLIECRRMSQNLTIEDTVQLNNLYYFIRGARCMYCLKSYWWLYPDSMRTFHPKMYHSTPEGHPK